ncbi:dicer-like protein 2-1 [Aspergillus heteromorphus CBS 117.55]|uniref:Dicer-like protein 2-1 n=1 Tax=Aspergillus heteromorphus CBS 117.55 TaxID=1448321 RepID=A0A317VXU3_9EURO|nr:dicer-like protein 2-1 [Aspergillus heteromorphus CBS 117.55]PWY79196.1 dicer-like protein 2-1 [Aspergillus heteromorphus CBS 117.55]
MAASIPADDNDAPTYRPRSYQVEMFEASLKENIIVTMGTGSGKTHIALLRIVRELETNPHQLIWFLTPTVALCLQQYKFLAETLPTLRARTLTSLDKVELWTEQSIWDAVLKDTQVVVSTHAVLADAMTHGFVRITQLGLMIFDEAHHCMRRHPANKIMQDFYHPALAAHGPDAVPKILGLTASPVMRSKRTELLKIESNLNARCRTPRMHRSELLTHTHRPLLQQILFSPHRVEEAGSKTLRALVNAWNALDLENDPYIKQLRRSPLDGRALQQALLTQKTYCNDQLKRFVARSLNIYEELGEWAADYFFLLSLEQLKSRANDSRVERGCNDEEKAYLLEILSSLPVPNINLTSSDPNAFPVSPKFQSLLAFLDVKGELEFSGLIFAKQRSTVSVMATLLASHPLTKDRFRCAAYVGWSSASGQKDVLGELLDSRMQRDTLSDFQSGKKNLIVATDVLEEGIDISACSVVVCYDKPPNLKSFVQRRGRARHKESTYAIMFAIDDESAELSKWEDLEKAMIEAYEDDERDLLEARSLETSDEEVIERFEVKATGAVLTADTAVAHLTHFCAVLPRQRYVDTRAAYSFEKDDSGLLKGMVILPACVHPDVRRAEGKMWWKTERAARKEAAFQAYKALYEFGLLSDNLLPFTGTVEPAAKGFAALQSILEVSEQYDPTVDWACSWSSPDLHQTRIAVRQNNAPPMFIRLTTPTGLPPIEPITLFWDSETTFTLTFETPERTPGVSYDAIANMREATALYLQAATSGTLGRGRDFVTLFGPDVHHSEIPDWINRHQGDELASDVHSRGDSPGILGLVRDRALYGPLMLFRRWIVTQEGESQVLKLECDRAPRRKNLLHNCNLAIGSTEKGILSEASSKTRVISASTATIDKLPYSESRFGWFIPALTDRLEANLVAARLAETVLRDIKFSDARHIITAITTPSSQSPTHYQRYEFFGDCVLKFTVSCQLFFEHPNWHEGLLSVGRDDIVRNPRLARAALESGLDAFIIDKRHLPRKWAAPLISTNLTTTSTRRKVSLKVLADVVEALVGAAYIDGGFPLAHECIQRFLPEVNLQGLHRNENLQPKPTTPQTTHHILNEAALMDHIGYTFTDPSFLVEALTHSSCQYDSSTQSYQRLEFLGDAVLDMIIMTVILAHPTQVSAGDMSLIKHAVANANLLAFLCMEFGFQEPSPTSTQPPLPIHNYMRFSAPQLHVARATAHTRHLTHRPTILEALAHGPNYPWLPLSQLNADKFYSDLVESLLGAIFVDSRGDMAACERFLERIGLLWYLHRMLDEGMNARHPKNTAQEMLARRGIGTPIFTKKRCEGNANANGNGDRDSDGDGDGNSDAGTTTYKCVVDVAGEQVVAVEGCISSEEAELKAALQVIDIFGAEEGGGEGEELIE